MSGLPIRGARQLGGRRLGRRTHEHDLEHSMIFRTAHCVSALALSIVFAPALHAQDAETPPTEGAAAPAADRRVDILNYQVEGNSVLSRKEIEQAVMPFLGSQRPLSDVDAARTALMEAYHAKGFETVNVVIPAQEVQGGNIRLKVVEMRVGRLRVDGATYYSPEDIGERVPSLEEGEVPNYNELSDDLARINRSQDRVVAPTLRAGLEPGTVDIDLLVEDKLPLHGTLELNDRASSNTERLKLSGSLTYANLFQLDHSLSLQGQMSPEDPSESWAVSASYAAPIPNTPITLVAYGVHTDSDVAALGGINVLGKGDILGLRAIYSSISGDPASPTVHQFTAGVDYKNFKENLLAENEDSASYTPIDYIPLMLRYALSKRTETFDFDLGIGAAFGLRGLAADDIEFGLKRFNANANWSVLRGDASYTRKLNDWRVGGSIQWQYAGEPLISNEQFALGGYDSVRGYYESFNLGDDGISGQFQIDTPSLHNSDLVKQLRFFTFVDGGYARIHDPLSVQDEHMRLLSVGGGLRLQLDYGLNGVVSVSRPLVDEEATLSDFGDGFRIQFRVWEQF
ncbi:ShlB/FhaC/HecB family hemolysin secretion/activation protein [Pelagerythrobacter rhizovicinus]|uniref:ShlB/FhaC/HecB family hemolysin secretion/activation protein n=1 Tax=Pelagerythrobacter rhizovicinus TaxID=2268576 RepID=A0A4Q2KLW5_9SPHN|nr:ShlB/FhaC/HecB family hemolysin secretion/activation protein [Pelagerythrobacter rhizovicinus]RXZ66314.1 ShlB/FhaC/HecB family hemolysin secretion/activation protein [Pelagerythrobacter rhizovicinus]